LLAKWLATWRNEACDSCLLMGCGEGTSTCSTFLTRTTTVHNVHSSFAPLPSSLPQNWIWAECSYAGLQSFAQVPLLVPNLLLVRQSVAVVSMSLTCCCSGSLLLLLPNGSLLPWLNFPVSCTCLNVWMTHVVCVWLLFTSTIFCLHPVSRVVTIQRRQGKWFNSSDSFFQLITRFSIGLQCFHLARLDVV